MLNDADSRRLSQQAQLPYVGKQEFMWLHTKYLHMLLPKCPADVWQTADKQFKWTANTPPGRAVRLGELFKTPCLRRDHICSPGQPTMLTKPRDKKQAQKRCVGWREGWAQ